MAVEKADGTENLRADPKVLTSGTLKATSPGGGTDAGGTENKRADFQVKTSERPGTPTFAKDSRPAGVQTFKDRP